MGRNVSTGDRLPIIQYWHSREIPDDIAELTASFSAWNPVMPHRIFSAGEAEELIASHFTEREVAAFRACAVPAMQADYFRYAAALALGGVCCDADLLCLQPLQPLVDSVDEGLLVTNEPVPAPLNGFFVFTAPGHPLLRLALDVATNNIERRCSQEINVATGPVIFAGLLLMRQSGSLEAALEAAPAFGMEGLAGSFLTAIDSDYDRLLDAFGGVRIAPFKEVGAYVAHPPASPSHKQTDTHWLHWQRAGREIFRQPSG